MPDALIRYLLCVRLPRLGAMRWRATPRTVLSRDLKSRADSRTRRRALGLSILGPFSMLAIGWHGSLIRPCGEPDRGHADARCRGLLVCSCGCAVLPRLRHAREPRGAVTAYCAAPQQRSGRTPLRPPARQVAMRPSAPRRNLLGARASAALRGEQFRSLAAPDRWPAPEWQPSCARASVHGCCAFRCAFRCTFRCAFHCAFHCAYYAPATSPRACTPSVARVGGRVCDAEVPEETRKAISTWRENARSSQICVASQKHGSHWPARSSQIRVVSQKHCSR